MGDVFFTSDLHLGHRSVAFARRYGHWPFDRSDVTADDVFWHDNLLTDKWDATVSPFDVVWVLGDLAITDSQTLRAIEWIRERPGRKHLVLGNHDPGHPMHNGAVKWQRRYFEAFDSVQIAGRRKIAMPDGARREVLLSHFPYTGDGEGREDRCDQWRLRNVGFPLLHGHVHSREQLTFAAANNGHYVVAVAPQIHVGVDAWDYAPVSLETIVELLAAESK